MKILSLNVNDLLISKKLTEESYFIKKNNLVTKS